jgi:ATP-binding cassette subfamily B protein
MTAQAARPRPLVAQTARVASLIWTERRPYLAGGVFVAMSIGTALAYPYVIRLIIDDAIQGGQVSRLNELSLVMVAILLVEAVSTWGRDYFFGIGADRVGSRLRRMVFDTLLLQDIEFFDVHDTGQITARLSADIPPLEYVLAEELADTCRAVVFCLCGIGLLFYTSPRLTFLMMIAVPPIALATSLLGRRVKALASDVQKAHADAGGAATEVLAGIRTVRAFSQEPFERARFHRQIARALALSREKVRAKALLGGLSLIAGECAALLAIWVGGSLIVTGRMTTGALISFILYALLVARGLRNASHFFAEASRAMGAAEWAFELVASTPRMSAAGSGQRPDRFDPSITFDRVRFCYPARPQVQALADVAFHIDAGEFVAVVGKSGSGKSTLLNLLLRFYDPTAGRVLVGDHDVRTLDLVWLRSQIAAVMQEPTLFSRTIRENIAYGVGAAEGAAVRSAAALASAEEFIRRLPDGYETTVGDRGVQLSGGQRQRLAIARAVLRRPAILVLDEATSALDAELEAVVQEALRALDYRPTTIVIAHRLSTVASVDRVIVFDGGRIVESGTHDELLHSSTFYRQLVQTQLVCQ